MISVCQASLSEESKSGGCDDCSNWLCDPGTYFLWQEEPPKEAVRQPSPVPVISDNGDDDDDDDDDDDEEEEEEEDEDEDAADDDCGGGLQTSQNPCAGTVPIKKNQADEIYFFWPQVWTKTKCCSQWFWLRCAAP